MNAQSRPIALRRRNQAPGRVEAGFSVVEIMVSLVLGLIVVAGVSQIYLASKQSYRLGEAQSRLQEDGRFALDYLVRNIRWAGHKSQPWTDGSVAFPIRSPANTKLPNFTAGQFITGLYGSGATADSAMISVRFQGRTAIPTAETGTGDQTIQDCLGGVLGAGVTATNTFAVDTANHELQCSTENPAPDDTPSTQPVISGFGNFLVLFGIDTDDDGRFARSANRYVSAANVGANWPNVTSVRIRFELRSTDDNLTASPTTYTFNGSNFTDRRVIRRFETTISLRNNVP